MVLKHTIYYPELDQDLLIKFNFNKGESDVYYMKNGDPGYPGSPDEIEIISVLDEDDQEIVDNVNLDTIEHSLWNNKTEWLYEN